MSRSQSVKPNFITTAVALLILVLVTSPCFSHTLDSLLVKALHSSCPELDSEVHHGLGVAKGVAGM